MTPGDDNLEAFWDGSIRRVIGRWGKSNGAGEEDRHGDLEGGRVRISLVGELYTSTHVSEEEFE